MFWWFAHYFTLFWIAYYSYLQTKGYIFDKTFKTIRRIPIVSKKIDDIKSDMEKNTFKECTNRLTKIPDEGLKNVEIISKKKAKSTNIIIIKSLISVIVS